MEYENRKRSSELLSLSLCDVAGRECWESAGKWAGRGNESLQVVGPFDTVYAFFFSHQQGPGYGERMQRQCPFKDSAHDHPGQASQCCQGDRGLYLG